MSILITLTEKYVSHCNFNKREWNFFVNKHQLMLESISTKHAHGIYILNFVNLSKDELACLFANVIIVSEMEM